ncbi:taurine ABC transporter substrate-binding protein [Nocardia camponoti]|uniref:Glycine/betaine ABC transporter substrate-binding protein n=1 Tax=Nocardia camponoti TaxID=1616106 RepID=A0A917QNV1_9NOCA|nr:glycine betaine ABC transporter substrate-binding protein [Nocardia camponoti]GGK60903.1 glycine/betaine ABC transporter substrate-binding protein [Nocardia camponoti]
MKSLRVVAAVSALAAVTAVTAGCVESGRTDTESKAAACPFAPDSSITSTVRLGYQAIPNADLIVKDRGLLQACAPNAKITWSQFSSGADVVQAFGAGSLDIATLGSSPATKALSSPLNLPVQVVWIHDVIGTSESLVVRDKSVTALAGLRGKKVATPFGSTSHYSLLAALDKAGLTGQVELINLQPEAIPGAWHGGQIDAAWVWDPTLSKLTEAGGKVVTSSAETAAAGAPTYDVALGNRKFLADNAAFAALWAKVQDAAVKEIIGKPADAAVSIGAQLGIAPDKVAPQLTGYKYLTAAEQAGDRYLGGGFAGDLEGTARFLLSQGSIAAVGSTQSYKDGIAATPAASSAK